MHPGVNAATGQVAPRSILRYIDEEAPRDCGQCGSTRKSQRRGCSPGWSLAREEGVDEPPPTSEGAPLKVGYHRIHSLGGRGRIVRKFAKSFKDGVHPQPMFVESVNKCVGEANVTNTLTDGPGWAVSDSKEDGTIKLKLLGGEPCIVRLDDGTEFVGLDDLGHYKSSHGKTEWALAEASGDFRYQGSSGEVLKVYRIVNAAQPTHGWIYKQYEGAHMIGYGNVYSPQTGYTDPEYSRKAERVGLFHFG